MPRLGEAGHCDETLVGGRRPTALSPWAAGALQPLRVPGGPYSAGGASDGSDLQQFDEPRYPDSHAVGRLTS